MPGAETTQVRITPTVSYPDRPELAGYRTELHWLPTTKPVVPQPLLIIMADVKVCLLYQYYRKTNL